MTVCYFFIFDTFAVYSQGFRHNYVIQATFCVDDNEQSIIHLRQHHELSCSMFIG